MVRLEDDYTSGAEQEVLLLTGVLNAIRVYNIPAINFAIMALLGTFLLKLTTKYTELYMKNSLITIIVTNLVLYGISELLAQLILSFKQAPAVSVRIHSKPDLSFNSDDVVYENNYNEEQNVDRFLDYLNGQNQPVPVELPPPTVLTYYNFSRLAGFMCWGFVMAFVQCWWYSVLQIYSKDPKVIEVLRKVMSDQFCFSPISLFCFFSYGTMVLESGTWDDTREKLRRIYLKTLVAQYSVWFPVQFINFLFVPRTLQVPFSSSVSVLWNCFLSMRNSTA